MKVMQFRQFLFMCTLACHLFAQALAADHVKVQVEQGQLIGGVENDGQVAVFKGIPYAAPPVGELRWQPPAQAKSWEGERDATSFGHKCMQNPMFSDMQFRDSGVSEDCLFLNVWRPNTHQKNLPVLVYFYGGGFAAGDGSEKRYDGASMAAKGIVSVTVNYRLGVFGLFAHPYLSKTSGYGGSGNYTFMDQAAALKWVKKNIHAFGGNPNQITIAGESAGSFSVSALMASPISRGLINGAIGESGSFLAGRLNTAQAAEQQGVNIVRQLLPESDLSAKEVLTLLRDIPADTLLAKTTEANFTWFTANIDGYVIPQSLNSMYAQGEFAKVPFLAGNNSAEGSYRSVMENSPATVDNYQAALKKRYPKTYKTMLALYPVENDEQVKDAAQAIASDQFISLSTWNWMESVSHSNPQGSYFYLYDHVRPLMKDEYWLNSWKQSVGRGAAHSAEIEYALGNLDVNNIFKWQAQDYKVSEIMQGYFVNFIKTGNPNGKGLVHWPDFKQDQQLVIGVSPYVESIQSLRKRYQGLNKLKGL